jgi:flagellar biosynthetic protein FliP
MNSSRLYLTILLAVVFLLLLPVKALGQDEGSEATGTAELGESSMIPSVPDILDVIDKAVSDQTSEEGERPGWTTPIKLVIIFTFLAILPSLIAMTTSFTRIVIVLSFVRRALSTQSIPPNIALMGLALFLTLYTMAPTFNKINESAVQPYLNDEINFNEAADTASVELKSFMIRQTRRTDLALFVKMAKVSPPETPVELPMHIIVPSFIISEFRTAFEMGCLMFIPFLLLDLVVASILLSAGMMMLPPVMISLPFKIILFILVDGWGILANSLSLSFR